MLDLVDEAGEYRLRGDEYELVVARGEPTRAILSVRGVRAAQLFLPGSCDADAQQDILLEVGPLELRQEASAITLVLTARSSLWDQATFHLRCTSQGVEHFARRRGARSIDNLTFFAAVSHANEPLLSRPYWRAVFDPEPNARRKHWFQPDEYATLGVSSDRNYYRGNWFFTPGPLCYALDLGDATLGIGVLAKRGENNFDQYEYRSQSGGFAFNLRYDGHIDTEGDWESPHLLLFAAEGDFEAIGRYCDLLRQAGAVPSINDAPQAEWWSQPIFCGWGEQVVLERRTTLDRPAPVLAADLCTERHYRSFLEILRGHELDPGIVVLDDKWQGHYGLNEPDPDKWPDLPAFVAGQHRLGRHVLLWLRAWGAEGVPAEECLVGQDGSLAVDPATSAYEARLRQQVRRMLVDIDADGFKIDFTHCLPVAPGVRSAGGIWGIELLRRLIEVLRDEAKQIKPDALIMAHTANPYFADLVDMLRLNDVANVPGSPSFLDSMITRARVARLASPHWLIDTDNWPSPNHAAWLEYCRAQPGLGVPSLYYASRIYHLSETGEITDEALVEADYKEVRDLWSGYRSGRAS